MSASPHDRAKNGLETAFRARRQLARRVNDHAPVAAVGTDSYAIREALRQQGAPSLFRRSRIGDADPAADPTTREFALFASSRTLPSENLATEFAVLAEGFFRRLTPRIRRDDFATSGKWRARQGSNLRPRA